MYLFCHHGVLRRPCGAGVEGVRPMIEMILYTVDNDPKADLSLLAEQHNIDDVEDYLCCNGYRKCCLCGGWEREEYFHHYEIADSECSYCYAEPIDNRYY